MASILLLQFFLLGQFVFFCWRCADRKRGEKKHSLSLMPNTSPHALVVAITVRTIVHYKGHSDFQRPAQSPVFWDSLLLGALASWMNNWMATNWTRC